MGWRAVAMSWDCHRWVTEKWCVRLYQRCTESHGFCVIVAKIQVINLLHMGWKGCNCIQSNSHSDGVCFICVFKVSARHFRSIEPQRIANKWFVELNAPAFAEKKSVWICNGFLLKWLKFDLIFNKVTTTNTIVCLNISFPVNMAQVNDYLNWSQPESELK